VEVLRDRLLAAIALDLLLEITVQDPHLEAEGATNKYLVQNLKFIYEKV
jgi:hypothetical protein